LETQVVEAADSITYDAHDTDDAVKLGLVSLAELTKVPMVQEAAHRVRERYGPVEGKLLRKGIVHELVDWQVSDLLATSAARLGEHHWQSPEEVRAAGVDLHAGSQLADLKAELESFLYDHVYRHPHLLAVRHKAQLRLRAMFEGYLARPELLPEKFCRRAQQVGLPRSVGDYLAGMTDRFCDEQYQRHFAAAGG
jgi:dGTPase